MKALPNRLELLLGDLTDETELRGAAARQWPTTRYHSA
jgi:hypothetical protein